MVCSKETAFEALQTVGLHLVANSIQITYDNQRNKYELPVFIIHQPSGFEVKKIENVDYGGKVIKITLQFFATMTPVELSLDDPVSKLLTKAIEVVSKAESFDPNESAIRLVYQGKVFKEDAKLGVYLKADSIVQVFKTMRKQ